MLVQRQGKGLLSPEAQPCTNVATATPRAAAMEGGILPLQRDINNQVATATPCVATGENGCVMRWCACSR